MLRRVFIARRRHLADPEGMPGHSNVRKYWELPRKYVLFEFYHPVFEVIYSEDPRIQRKGWEDESVKAETVAAIGQQRKLLAPLFRGRSRIWHGIQLALPLSRVSYDFLDNKSVSWPRLGFTRDWETAVAVQITGQLATSSTEAKAGFEKVFQEWVDWATTLGEINKAESISYSERDYNVHCEFPGACGDVLVVLIQLLAATRKFSSVESLGFVSDPNSPLWWAPKN